MIGREESRDGCLRDDTGSKTRSRSEYPLGEMGKCVAIALATAVTTGTPFRSTRSGTVLKLTGGRGRGLGWTAEVVSLMGRWHAYRHDVEWE